MQTAAEEQQTYAIYILWSEIRLCEKTGYQLF